MTNFLDYINWRGDLSFAQSPFNDVDNLICAQLAYTNFDEILSEQEEMTIKDFGKKFFDKYSEEEIGKTFIQNVYAAAIVEKAMKSERFANLKLYSYVNKIDYENISQFAAVTINIDDKTEYVAFRGTDNTIVGWKEDFNMCFLSPVPAQIEAVKYMNKIGKKNKSFLLGGHSKGGNLAIYAATKCDDKIQKKIKAIYNNDGPGFGNGFMDGLDYKAISRRIRTIIPQSSVVGIMLEHEKNYKVIKSNQIAFRQHDTLSWEVLGTGFVYLEELTKGSKHVGKTITNWLDTLNKGEKEEFIEALFGILEAPGAKTFEDVIAEKWTILRNIKNLDEDTKKAIFKALGLLVAENNKIIKHNILKKTPFKPNEEKAFSE